MKNKTLILIVLANLAALVLLTIFTPHLGPYDRGILATIHVPLRAGVDAMIAIWRELPRRRWRAVLLSLPGIHRIAGILYDNIFAPVLIAWSRAIAPEADGNES